jgi:hypothetical protein
VAQGLARGRDLVTYWRTSWLFSRSPDEPSATGARAPRLLDRGSDRGYPVCLTNGGDSRTYWRDGTPVWRRTSDAIDCAGWDRTTLCNADTHADTIWPRAMVKVLDRHNQIRVGRSATRWNKTERNKRRKPFSESSEEDEKRNKTKELYAARCRPKVHRHSQRVAQQRQPG